MRRDEIFSLYRLASALVCTFGANWSVHFTNGMSLSREFNGVKSNVYQRFANTAKTEPVCCSTSFLNRYVAMDGQFVSHMRSRIESILLSGVLPGVV
ncbi:hypothetical protein B0H19DRAFT_1117207 [Mycena capillaripes]|nr:hypothetical protein B0H19DRAFT_1117207 [Mycena capillaripes]